MPTPKKAHPPRKGRANYRSKAKILQDRAEVTTRILQGQQLTTISQELKIPYELLRFDIKQIEKSWMDTAVRNIDLVKERLIRKLENLEAVYWDAWERSKKARIRTKQFGEMKGTKLKVLEGETMREEPYGDPRFLLGVRQCIMDLAKITGVIQDIRGANDPAVPIIPQSNQAVVIIMPAAAPPRPIPAIPIAASVAKG